MTQPSNDQLLSEAHDALLDELTALREIKMALLGLQIAANLDEEKYAEHLIRPMNRVLGGIAGARDNLNALVIDAEAAPEGVSLTLTPTEVAAVMAAIHIARDDAPGEYGADLKTAYDKLSAN